MFCSQCAASLDVGDVYCPSCSKPVASFNFTGWNAPQVEPIAEIETQVQARGAGPRVGGSEKRNMLVSVAGGLGLLVAAAAVLGSVVIAAFLLMIADSKNPVPPSTNRQDRTADRGSLNEPARNDLSPKRSESPEPPEAQQERRLVVNDVFPVGAGTYRSFRFTTGSGGVVVGGFVTYGGSRDIHVCLLDETNFRFFEARRRFDPLYLRLSAERGKLHVPVGPGSYYLIFSNRHAILTGKHVAAEVYLNE